MDRLFSTSKGFSKEKYNAFLGNSSKQTHIVKPFNPFKPKASHMVLRPRVDTPRSIAPTIRAANPKTVPSIISDTPRLRKSNAAPKIELAPTSNPKLTSEEGKDHTKTALGQTSKDHDAATPVKSTRGVANQRTIINEVKMPETPKSRCESQRGSQRSAKSPVRQRTTKRVEVSTADSPQLEMSSMKEPCTSSAAIETPARRQRALKKDEVSSTNSSRLRNARPLNAPCTSDGIEKPAERLRGMKRSEDSTPDSIQLKMSKPLNETPASDVTEKPAQKQRALKRGEVSATNSPRLRNDRPLKTIEKPAERQRQRAVKESTANSTQLKNIKPSSKSDESFQTQRERRTPRSVVQQSPFQYPVDQKVSRKPKPSEAKKKRKFDELTPEECKRKKAKLDDSRRPMSPIPYDFKMFGNENENPKYTQRLRDNEAPFIFRSINNPGLPRIDESDSEEEVLRGSQSRFKSGANDSRLRRDYPSHYQTYRPLNTSYASVSYSQRSGISARPLLERSQQYSSFRNPQQLVVDSSGFKIPGAPVRSKPAASKTFSLLSKLFEQIEILEMNCNETECEYYFEQLEINQLDLVIERERLMKEQLSMSFHDHSIASGSYMSYPAGNFGGTYGRPR